MLYDITDPLRWMAPLGAPSYAPARLIPSAALLTSGSSTTDADHFDTASVNPTAGRLLLAVFCSGQSAAPAVTVSGCGVTWVSEESRPTSSGNRRLTVFRAMGAATAGAITFTVTSGTMLSGIWDIIEIANTNTSGADGAGAVIQSVSQSPVGGQTTITSTLAALEHANNLHVCLAAIEQNALVTKDADFALLSSDSVASSNIGLNSSYAANQVDSTVTFSSAVVATISLEIKAG